jgi:integrase
LFFTRRRVMDKTIVGRPSFSHRQAWKIMGRNFLGINEVAQHFGVTFSPEQLAKLQKIPFRESTLKRYSRTHLLVAGFPLSILDICKRMKQDLLHLREYNWYSGEAFVGKEKVDPRWYVIRKRAIPESINKSFREQLALLPKRKEEVPRACEVAYAVILYYLSTGIRLFENIYARCRDITSRDHRVMIGYFGPGGLFLEYELDSSRRPNIGIAVSLKH